MVDLFSIIYLLCFLISTRFGRPQRNACRKVVPAKVYPFGRKVLSRETFKDGGAYSKECYYIQHKLIEANHAS